MADPTTPADRAALITMTEARLSAIGRHAQRDIYPHENVELDEALAELDAQRRALCEAQRTISMLRAALETEQRINQEHARIATNG